MTRFRTLRVRRATLPLLVLLASASATASSCARFRTGDTGDEVEQRAAIVFANQSLDQADVFAVASSSETIRIGTVLPGSTETLALPSTITTAGPVNIIARVLSRSYAPQSGPVSFAPGTRLRITLPMDQRTLIVLPAP